MTPSAQFWVISLQLLGSSPYTIAGGNVRHQLCRYVAEDLAALLKLRYPLACRPVLTAQVRFPLHS